MSAPIKNAYLTHIEECQQCLAECYRCIDATAPNEACHECLRECANSLKTAVRLMQTKSPLASRYLVDCAEACAECARCCSKFDNVHTRRCVVICKAMVECCRRSSLIDV